MFRISNMLKEVVYLSTADLAHLKGWLWLFNWLA